MKQVIPKLPVQPGREPSDTALCALMATSPRFKGRVAKDSERKNGEFLLSSTPVVVLSSILGRTPNLDEYKVAVQGIDLTTFAPPVKEMVAAN